MARLLLLIHLFLRAAFFRRFGAVPVIAVSKVFIIRPGCCRLLEFEKKIVLVD